MVALLISLQFEVNKSSLFLKSDTAASATLSVSAMHCSQGLDKNPDEDDLDDGLTSLAEPTS